MGVKIEIKAGELSRALRKTSERCRNMGPVWEDIGQRMCRSVGKNFRVGGRPDKWEPLSYATLMQKFGGEKGAFTRSRRKKTKGAFTRLRKKQKKDILENKTLVQSSELLNSILKGDKAEGYKVVRDGVEIGTNIKYAAIHQFGGKAGRGRSVTIPARPFLVVQPEDEAYIPLAIEAYLAEPLQ